MPILDTLVQNFRNAYGHAPTHIARAPGRIEFIGNHTDYNAGTVLGAAIDRSIYVAISPNTQNQLRLTSTLTNQITTLDPSAPGTSTPQKTETWLNYPLGVWHQFPNFNLTRPAAFNYAVHSDLPPGSGLSSSAAIEIASALAFAALANNGTSPSRETLAKLGRAAENQFVGVPCGILDQACSAFGQKDHLVHIDCRHTDIMTIPMPPGAHFWIFNTHTKHALVDGLYSARHNECATAARLLNIPYLADTTLANLEANKTKLPEIPYLRARHILEEIDRVTQTIAALKNNDLQAVGKLLTASHRSSQTQFQNSTPELDHLVDTLIQNPNTYGARLTGGGFGGAVMALTNSQFSDTDAQLILQSYHQKFKALPAPLHLTPSQGAQLIQ